MAVLQNGSKGNGIGSSTVKKRPLQAETKKYFITKARNYENTKSILGFRAFLCNTIALFHLQNLHQDVL